MRIPRLRLSQEWQASTTQRRARQRRGPADGVHSMRDDYDVYIGRGKDPHSLEWGEWGNPLSHRVSGSATVTRANSVGEAIESYKQDLWRRLRDGRLSLEKLAALKGKRLRCWVRAGTVSRRGPGRGSRLGGGEDRCGHGSRGLISALSAPAPPGIAPFRNKSITISARAGATSPSRRVSPADSSSTRPLARLRLRS
jgi:hypothetical protein